MTNEIAASVPETDQRVMPLARFLEDADLDMTCLHTSIQPDDAVTIARTVIAYLDQS